MKRREFLGVVGAGVCGVAVANAFGQVTSKRPKQSNFIFMVSDDQGWDGLSVQMHDAVAGSKSDFYRTPNIEKLAQQGMRFSAAYSPAPVCAPTRCSLQTGKSPAQNHWTKASPILTARDGRKFIPPMHGKNLASDETTIAEMLKQAGYTTAHYGKWHLGGGGPGRHGYDVHDGNTGNRDAAPFVDPNPVDIFGMSRRANALMEENTKAGKPFFIQLSYYALHYPQNALASTRQAYEKRLRGRSYREINRAAITEDLDTGVGMIMDQVEKLGIGDHTYLIYMSDNGAGGRGRGVLRGGKGSLWEGGIRVPLIIQGPGIEPNTFCDERVVGFDLFPTLCELGGVSQPLPTGIEGGSITSLLSGGKGMVERPREELVFHFPHYQSGDGPHSAILLDDYKLIKLYETDKLHLFDLSKDIGEENDLAGRKPEVVTKLHDRLNAYLASVDAQMPQPNPYYDPSWPVGGRRGRNNRRRRNQR
ncbi:MAG: sulfatase [Gemmatimonadetes bacterium]|nr:sulfatase [Gemmatimonadota bacterium]